ncbi:LysM domain-containing protein [Sporomusa silvacetica]|uniref:LysM peptidoglycan-binding domain-containing protein n=1 Tax=Sporomusa silvacetica TaxID=55504 RepID=UPI000B99E845
MLLLQYFVGIDDTVYVKPRDTVWQIAAKYTTDKDDVKEVIYEIWRINKLDNNASVYPGQVLKVPVIVSK